MLEVVNIDSYKAFVAYKSAIMRCFLAGENFCKKQLAEMTKIIEMCEPQGEPVPDEWLAMQLASEHVLKFISGEARIGEIVVVNGQFRFAFTQEPTP